MYKTNLVRFSNRAMREAATAQKLTLLPLAGPDIPT
jgi:hypothetical protein